MKTCLREVYLNNRELHLKINKVYKNICFSAYFIIIWNMYFNIKLELLKPLKCWLSMHALSF